MRESNKGFIDVGLALIITCFVVGGLYAAFSKKVDSPAEQASEAYLKTKGIDVDFSAEKKKEAAVEGSHN